MEKKVELLNGVCARLSAYFLFNMNLQTSVHSVVCKLFEFTFILMSRTSSELLRHRKIIFPVGLFSFSLLADSTCKGPF